MIKKFRAEEVVFTSDTHFFHDNVVDFCDRPWTAEDQTIELIKRWNAKVSPTQFVVCLGDFAFLRGNKTKHLLHFVMGQLNGKKIMIMGNHDSLDFWRRFKQKHGEAYDIISVEYYRRLVVNKQPVMCCHYPIYSWDSKEHGSWHLHGHMHGSLPPYGKMLDVGIDNHPNFELWTWSEIVEAMKERPETDKRIV